MPASLHTKLFVYKAGRVREYGEHAGCFRDVREDSRRLTASDNYEPGWLDGWSREYDLGLEGLHDGTDVVLVTRAEEVANWKYLSTGLPFIEELIGEVRTEYHDRVGYAVLGGD